MLELFHRYCDPTTIAFDACAGTCVSVLAMLHLGLQGIVNDRDAGALALGEARARVYMDYLFKENEYQYPALGDSHKQVYDGTNLYGWVHNHTEASGEGRKQSPFPSPTQRP